MNAIVPTSPALPVQSADQHPVIVYLASLPSSGSRRTMQTALESIWLLLNENDGQSPREGLMTFPWWELRYQHTQFIRSRLIQSELKPNTVNVRLSALRGVLLECWRLGLVSAEDYQRAVDFKNVRGETLPAGRHIRDQELRRLLKGCLDDGVRGVRDLAILGMLATCGLRRAELSGLNLADLDLTTGAFKVLKGKGRKERVGYVRNKTRRLLDHWLDLRGDEPGPLFQRLRKGDHLTGHPFGGSAVYRMIRERTAAAGLKVITPHDFRRLFIGNLLEAGVDSTVVAALTGHASVDMVKRYDRRPEKVRADAIDKLDLPI